MDKIKIPNLLIKLSILFNILLIEPNDLLLLQFLVYESIL